MLWVFKSRRQWWTMWRNEVKEKNAALTELAKERARVCVWTSSGNYSFNTGCGGAFHSDEKWKRCQECGGKVEVVDAAREEG